jgi:hypothetical protein
MQGLVNGDSVHPGAHRSNETSISKTLYFRGAPSGSQEIQTEVKYFADQAKLY